ncbi:hypothetical protein [Paraburkholderia nodosa]|uniref:hypothetical protein n=1 Tax=Paraburkholderia nodosa TaxID=392320 RepID=UPI00114D1249|nr:hypothetical protein [Paraburkholderia nodosa]
MENYEGSLVREEEAQRPDREGLSPLAVVFRCASRVLQSGQQCRPFGFGHRAGRPPPAGADGLRNRHERAKCVAVVFEITEQQKRLEKSEPVFRSSLCPLGWALQDG